MKLFSVRLNLIQLMISNKVTNIRYPFCCWSDSVYYYFFSRYIKKDNCLYNVILTGVRYSIFVRIFGLFILLYSRGSPYCTDRIMRRRTFQTNRVYSRIIVVLVKQHQIECYSLSKINDRRHSLSSYYDVVRFCAKPMVSVYVRYQRSFLYNNNIIILIDITITVVMKSCPGYTYILMFAARQKKKKKILLQSC